MTEQRQLIGQILKGQGSCHQGQIQEALATQRDKGGQIGQILIDLGYITREALLRGLAEQAGMPTVDLKADPPSDALLEKIDPQTAQAFRVVPFNIEAGTLHVALADPMNTSILDDLGFMTGMTVKGALADEATIDEIIRKRYAQEEDLDSLLDDLEAEASSIDDADALARSTPVVRLLNHVLFAAIRDRSSDVHLEPFESEFKIRYRVDGTLFELRSPPKHLAEALISRVKVLANLDMLVVPSVWYENTPFSVLEALHASLPVIASDLGGITELVEHGINGLLFPAGDSDSLATAIQTVLDDRSLLS
ncbi:MAG: Flp pilus assembly complex ATPase component TadA, partial [Planctomycetes bacterium]|nr:Flp pilus assembly complex ATPase component TadA [Planctomycetota bacterium]